MATSQKLTRPSSLTLSSWSADSLASHLVLLGSDEVSKIRAVRSFFELARIIKSKQPRLLVFENVKGLLSHDGGRTFTTIIATIDELGYDCQWQVLNSKNHGVPQNRERVIIVGNLRGTRRPQVFPITEDDGILTPTVGADTPRPQTELSTTVRTGMGTKADSTFIVHNIHGGFGEEKIREFHEYSPTIRTPGGGGHLPSVVDGKIIRRFTPIELERLQGFPDDWTQFGEHGEAISDTQRGKMCGNAVTTNVIQDVFERIFND